MEDQWLAWAKRLHAIAGTGLHFGREDFDKERYQEVADIAEAMLASLGEVPLERIGGLVPGFGEGYATPLVDVRGAVIRDERILLVQEKSDGLWTMPGGYADVGLSAAENVVKEVREEAGIDVSAQALVGVRHKAKHEYRPDVRDFYKFLFLCEESALVEPTTGPETQGAEFFARDALPPLSTGRIIEKDVEAAFEYLAHGSTVFD